MWSVRKNSILKSFPCWRARSLTPRSEWYCTLKYWTMKFAQITGVCWDTAEKFNFEIESVAIWKFLLALRHWLLSRLIVCILKYTKSPCLNFGWIILEKCKAFHFSTEWWLLSPFEQTSGCWNLSTDLNWNVLNNSSFANSTCFR